MYLLSLHLLVGLFILNQNWCKLFVHSRAKIQISFKFVLIVVQHGLDSNLQRNERILLDQLFHLQLDLLDQDPGLVGRAVVLPVVLHQHGNLAATIEVHQSDTSSSGTLQHCPYRGSSPFLFMAAIREILEQFLVDLNETYHHTECPHLRTAVAEHLVVLVPSVAEQETLLVDDEVPRRGRLVAPLLPQHRVELVAHRTSIHFADVTLVCDDQFQ